MPSAFDITFPNGHTARAAVVEQTTKLAAALDGLGLVRSVPVLVLVGGAGSLTEIELAHLRPLFIEALAPVASQMGAAVVDGGTAAGVMRLMGEARQQTGGTFPLIGVAAVHTVMLPNAADTTPDAAPLESGHTHFVLVPGSTWGDEVTWISRVAGEIAMGSPSLTVLISGGSISYHDIDESVGAARPVLVIADTGGTAEVLAAAIDDERPPLRTRAAVESGLLQRINSDNNSLPMLMSVTREHLSPKEIKDGRDKLP
jgi:hypothetical protein